MKTLPLHPFSNSDISDLAREVLKKQWYNSNLPDIFRPLALLPGMGPQTLAEIAFALFLALEDPDAKTTPPQTGLSPNGNTTGL